MQRKTNQADENASTQEQGETSPPAGSERARDEQRKEGGPRYGGEAWKVADARGDNRFGKARNDDADPLELVKPGQEDEEIEAQASAPAQNLSGGETDEEADVTVGDQKAASDEQMTSHVESGGEAAGMGRGEKPRKPKSRAKK